MPVLRGVENVAWAYIVLLLSGNWTLWEIDLIIWTHKLLWDSVIYKNLWLLIVDEEHKFWVLQKEKIMKKIFKRGWYLY